MEKRSGVPICQMIYSRGSGKLNGFFSSSLIFRLFLCEKWEKIEIDLGIINLGKTGLDLTASHQMAERGNYLLVIPSLYCSDDKAA